MRLVRSFDAANGSKSEQSDSSNRTPACTQEHSIISGEVSVTVLPKESDMVKTDEQACAQMHIGSWVF